MSTAAVTTTAATVEPATTAAAVESATTTAAVESTAAATTVEAASYVSAVEAAGSANVTAVEATRAAYKCVAAPCVTGRTVAKAVTSTRVTYTTVIALGSAIAFAAVISAAPVVSTTPIVSTAAVVASATPIPVIPGAGPNEEPTHEPARSVIAVGRASVRIIGVVTPGADRSRVSVISVTVISDTNTHTYLCVSRNRHQRYWNHQRAEQQKISEQLHFRPPRQGIMHCVTTALAILRAPLVSFGCLLLQTTILYKSCGRLQSLAGQLPLHGTAATY